MGFPRALGFSLCRPREELQQAEDIVVYFDGDNDTDLKAPTPSYIDREGQELKELKDARRVDGVLVVSKEHGGSSVQ